MNLIIGALTVAALASYPPFVKKNLMADNDLRGHRAPKLVVQSWVSGGAPSAKGKTLLVDIWATWCPGCRQLVPKLNRWAKRFKGELEVVGISNEAAATVGAFASAYHIGYHVASDPEEHVYQALGVEVIPHVIVISPDGIVRWQGYTEDAADPLTDTKLASIIEQGKRLASR